MSTTPVTTWVTDISQLGPIYPFVGTEFVFFALGIIFWLGFHILQARLESRELRETQESLSKNGRLAEAIEMRDQLDQLK